MAITLNQIYKEVDEKKLSPIYLITGEEPYYIDLISNKFIISYRTKIINVIII